MRLSLSVKLIALPILALVLVFLLSLITANKADAAGWGWAAPIKQSDNDFCGTGTEMLVFAKTYEYGSPNIVASAGTITLRGGVGNPVSGVRQTPFMCFDRAADNISVTVDGDGPWIPMGVWFKDNQVSHNRSVVMIKILVKKFTSPYTIRNVSPLSGWVRTRNPLFTVNAPDVSPEPDGNATCVDGIFFLIINSSGGLSGGTKPFSSPCKGNYSATYNSITGGWLSDGVYRWQAEASDNGFTGPGSVSAWSGLNTFSIDATKPIIVTVSHSPSTVYDSSTVTFSARAEDATSGLRWIQIEISTDNGATWDRKESGNIWGFQSATFSRNGGPYPAGTRVYYRARARDIAGNTSGWTTRSFDVRVTAKPDYVPITFTGPTSVNLGDTVTYTGRTRNFGVGASVSSKSTAFSFPIHCTPGFKDFTVPPLPVSIISANHNYSCTWQDVGTFPIRYIVDADNVIAESNESNNIATLMVTVTSPIELPLPCPATGPGLGDVNFDGFISIVDATWISEYIAGLRSFSATQLTRADVNGDGLVNVSDAFEILVYIANGTEFSGCLPPAAPDLVPDTLRTNIPGTIETDDLVWFNGIVKNDGTASAGSASTARFRVDINNDGTWYGVVGTDPVPDLLPTFSSPVSSATLLQRTYPAGTHKVELCADYLNTVSESNEGNNCMTILFTVDVAVPDPWIQTEGGNVGAASGSITMLPGTPPSGKVNADYLVIANGAVTRFKSAKDWLVGSYAINPAIIPTYDELKSKYSPANYSNPNVIPSSRVFEFSPGNFVISNGTNLGSGSQPTVFFIKGSLIITKALVDMSRPILFIVEDDIFVNKDVKIMNGFYLVGDRFRTEDDSSSSTDRLVVNGSVIAGRFRLERDLEGNNDVDPAEKFIYQPSYLYHFKDLLGDSRATFEEVAP